MSTDSTELTFVRCPSCRSLVPAVSTRCRMCGASLDASATIEEEEKQQKSSGRVRQRTMSTQKDREMNATRSLLREEEQPAPAAQSKEPEPEEEEELLADDPLSAYIEEVEVEGESDGDDRAAGPEEMMEPEEPVRTQYAKAQPAQEPEEEELQPEAVDEEEDGFDLDQMPTDEEQEEEPAEPEEPEEEEEFEAAPPSIEEDPEPDDFEEPVKPAVEKTEALRFKPKEEPKPEPERPRVIIESGRGKQRRQGLSFDKPRPAAPPPPAPEVEAAPEPAPIMQAKPEPAPMRAAPPSRPAERSSRPEERAPREEQRPQREEQRALREEPKEEPSETPRRAPAPEAARRQAGPQAAPPRKGRLFGWFVSYAEPGGAGLELREGKFFVSRSSLKSTDLVLDSDSVSTPHAMVMISAEGGLRIHDLMSERGVFVRRRGDDTYRREEDLLILENGDWVRFGDVEFLVSLIPHVGVK